MPHLPLHTSRLPPPLSPGLAGPYAREPISGLDAREVPLRRYDVVMLRESAGSNISINNVIARRGRGIVHRAGTADH